MKFVSGSAPLWLIKYHFGGELEAAHPKSDMLEIGTMKSVKMVL